MKFLNRTRRKTSRAEELLPRALQKSEARISMSDSGKTSFALTQFNG